MNHPSPWPPPASSSSPAAPPLDQRPAPGVTDAAQLVQVVARFARTAMGDFSLEGLLTDLATAAVDVLDIDGAGVTYLHGGRMSIVHALPPRIVPVERVQEDDQEGPCHDAVRTRSWVVEGQLSDNADRWPRFAERALQAGLHAVASLPLVGREQAWGAMDLYRSAPGVFSVEELAAAQVLADVACGYVVMAHDRDLALVAQQDAVQAHRQAMLAQEEALRALRDAELAEQRAAHAATHDGLTGLANRSLLQDRLRHAVATSARNATALAVVFLDLDGFKEVNDTFGHHAGDELLRQVGVRLSDVVRDGDTLARWGGDEFVVVCESLHPVSERVVLERGVDRSDSRARGSNGDDAEDDGQRTVVDEHVLEVIVRRLQGCFNTPFVLPAATMGGEPAVTVQIGASFGVAASTFAAGEVEATHAEALQRNADQAMYRAKAGRGRDTDHGSGERARVPVSQARTG